MHILPKIHSPEDVKRLKSSCLGALAGEIRQTIIETTAKNGGHLASNLGMVEATVALHRVFNCPEDSFVFDVSHQAYAHKLLTGRFDDFHTLRQMNGISGFTNRDESEYDFVTAGHSGTAISTAIGVAEANRLAGRDNWTVAVVGDGSFTNGMVYEALNQLAARDLRLIILLNDNEMSISKNVGGLAKYLAYIRISEGYFSFKYYTKQAMQKLPFVGQKMIGASRIARDAIKRVTNSETWFESFGLEYIGPANGNDVGQMITVLTEAKSKNCPVIVHMTTKKGLGYRPSEEHPESYHSVGKFSLGEETCANCKKTPEMSTFTEIVGQELLRAAENDPKLCAITAAMAEGCGLLEFERRFPERFFDVGIAEEHEITMAGGLSLGGMLPVAILYSTFAQRTFDQVWHDIVLQRSRAVICLSHCGLVPGDGVTHQGIYDVPLFSSLENTVIYSPDTYENWRKSFKKARENPYLTIIRYPKGGEAEYPDENDITAPIPTIVWNSAENYRYCTAGNDESDSGRNFLVLTYGRVSGNVVKAVVSAAKKFTEYRFTVVVLEQIMPIPIDDKLLEIINSADKLLFVEEGVRSGGIGEKLAADERVTKKITIHAIENARIPHGDLDSIMKFCGLDEQSIENRILKQI